MSRTHLGAMLICVGVTVACLLPFLGKAFHIDDPLFVWNAQQILIHPFDFFGLEVNWLGSTGPMAFQTMNPPLTSYVLAGVMRTLGGGEVALHAAFLLFPIGCALGTMALARELDADPTVAALAAILTPVFLVASTSLMCDVMMLSFWLASVTLWLRGLRTASLYALLGAGALAALAVLTKYFAISLVPLLLAQTLFARYRGRTLPRAWPVALSLPLATLALYELATQWLYGAPLFSAAMAYSAHARAVLGFSAGRAVATSLTFAGGCVASAFFFAPLLWSRRAQALAAGAALLAIGALAMRPQLAGLGSAASPPSLPQLAQLAVFALAGVSALALAAVEWRRARDEGALLLALWIAGTFVFAGFLNWSNNGRSILPMAPAVGILIARRLAAARDGEQPATALLARAAPALVASGLLAFFVAQADATLAASAREAAQRIGAAHQDDPTDLWFQGHWGFQYYLEPYGARALETRGSRLRRADRIVFPSNNAGLVALPAAALELRNTVEIPGPRWLTTMSRELGAGFYASSVGPLPFAFGAVPSERYGVYSLTQPVSLPAAPR